MRLALLVILLAATPASAGGILEVGIGGGLATFTGTEEQFSEGSGKGLAPSASISAGVWLADGVSLSARFGVVGLLIEDDGGGAYHVGAIVQGWISERTWISGGASAAGEAARFAFDARIGRALRRSPDDALSIALGVMALGSQLEGPSRQQHAYVVIGAQLLYQRH